ncbi:hypothetical protein KJ966_27475 [bacterium]|nr:hypothetical protein [bacterium]
MNANCFVDANILVYYPNSSEPEKLLITEEWLTDKRKRQIEGITVINPFLSQ